MIDIKNALNLYKKVCKVAKDYQGKKLNVSFVRKLFEDKLGIYVDRVEYDGNDFDIDLSNDKVLICVSFHNTFNPSPIFEIAVSNETELEHLGGWVSYDIGSGCLDFPFMQ